MPDTAPLDTEMDGLTVVLTCEAPVDMGVTNSMKLAIADTSDTILDSAVFIAGGSLTTTPPDAPIVDAGDDTGGPEGAPGVSVGASAEEGATLLWTYEAGEDVDDGATCEFFDPGNLSPIFECTDDGTFTVTLTATNEAGSGSDSAVVTLINQAPEVFIDEPVGELLFATGEPVSVSASFFDFGANETHTCSIDWGDGSIDDGAITDADCTGTHAYSGASLYTIIVTVTDDDGDAGSASTDIEVEDSEEPPPPTR